MNGIAYCPVRDRILVEKIIPAQQLSRRDKIETINKLPQPVRLGWVINGFQPFWKHCHAPKVQYNPAQGNALGNNSEINKLINT